VSPCVAETSDALETCSICLGPLPSEDVTPMLAYAGGQLQPASCRHYCHLRCALRLCPQRCPVCRITFVQLRRVTRAGMLGMTAAEVCAALSRLHGRVSVTAAANLLAAVFPITASTAFELVEKFVDTFPGRPDGFGGPAIQEEAMSHILHYLSLHSPGAVVRPLSFYAGGCFVPGGLRGRALVLRRLRRCLLRFCAGLGGACHGLCVGLGVGALAGLMMRRPPRLPEEVKFASPGPRMIQWSQILGHLADSLAPWHIFGSAVFAVALAIAVGCVSMLLARALIAATRALMILSRLVHQSLWIWAARSLAEDAHDDEIGLRLWYSCIVAGAVSSAFCGFVGAAASVDPALHGAGASGDTFWPAAIHCFRAGTRSYWPLPTRLRRRRWRLRRRSGGLLDSGEADSFGDGSLRNC